jgi:Flp pilus assembly protein TadD
VLHENPTHAEATAIAQDAEAAIVIEQCIDNAKAALEAGDRERALAEVRRGLTVNPNDARLVALFKEATRE